MSFERITIVSVSGHYDGELSLPSIMKSIEELPGSKGLLLSIKKPTNLPCDIEWREIPQLNYVQYSMFIIHFLKSYITTDYILIVQDDGWVLNGKNWNDEFFNYDYIGAPCHAAYVNDEVINNFGWLNFNNPVVIQNGGLSLRSKKLLDILSNFSQFYDFSKSVPECNEDVLITGLNRDVLEKNGIKFAPIDLAKYFSIEFFAPILHDNLLVSQIFGIHGNIRKLTKPNVVQYHMPTGVGFESIYREVEIYNYFINNGFSVDCTTE